MKRRLYSLLFVAFLLLSSGAGYAQEGQLKVMSWNVLSFEQTDNSGTINGFDVSGYVEKIRSVDPDVVCLNEFETASERMGKEKMAELAAALDMYGYFIESYPKGTGYYGNVILSKYPIVASRSYLFPYEHVKGPGNYQWNDGDYLKNYGADQRSIGCADIMVPVSGTGSRIIRVICTHFDHEGDAKVRENQSKWAIEYFGLDNPEYPTLLLGDLNTAGGLAIDQLAAIGNQIICHWVDHIWTFPKDRWETVNGDIVSVGKLSDHDAIFATVKFPNE